MTCDCAPHTSFQYYKKLAGHYIRVKSPMAILKNYDYLSLPLRDRFARTYPIALALAFIRDIAKSRAYWITALAVSENDVEAVVRALKKKRGVSRDRLYYRPIDLRSRLGR